MEDAVLSGRVLGPLFGAVVTAFVGILVWVGNRVWEHRRDERLRRQKVDDIQRALRAELRSHNDQLRESELELHWEYMRQRIVAGGDGPDRFVPVVPSEERDMVFRTYLGELHVLPAPVVEPVVLYYAQIAAIQALARDMQTERFAAIDSDRMAAMYGDFIRMKKAAYALNIEAWTALDRALDR